MTTAEYYKKANEINERFPKHKIEEMTTKLMNHIQNTTPPKFSENHKYVIRDIVTQELDSSCDTHEEAQSLIANAELTAKQNGYKSIVPFYEIVTMSQYNTDEIENYGIAQSEDEVEAMTTRTTPMCGECFGDPRLER